MTTLNQFTLTLNPAGNVLTSNSVPPITYSALLQMSQSVQSTFITTFNLKQRSNPTFNAILCPRASRITGQQNSTCNLGTTCNSATCQFKVLPAWTGADFFLSATWEDCQLVTPTTLTGAVCTAPQNLISGQLVSINAVPVTTTISVVPSATATTAIPTQSNANSQGQGTSQTSSNSAASLPLIFGIIGGLIGLLLIISTIAWHRSRQRKDEKNFDPSSVFSTRLNANGDNIILDSSPSSTSISASDRPLISTQVGPIYNTQAYLNNPTGLNPNTRNVALNGGLPQTQTYQVNNSNNGMYAYYGRFQNPQYAPGSYLQPQR